MRRLLLAAFGSVLFLTSCGSAAPILPVQPAEPEASFVRLPSQVQGLEVVEEDVGERLEGISGSYLESVGLFSFREADELLRATLQVGRWNDVAPDDRDRFRDAIVSQLGDTVPVELRVGDELVYLSAGDQQSVYTWFVPDGFYVLSVRGDYRFPRGLVRSLVESGAGS